MGLIKSIVSSVGGTLHEQWQDYITCDDMPNNVLMVKKTTDTKQISAKSRIEVKQGQIAVIFDSGKILDATAEPGIYTFDASSSASLFAGQFGGMFKEMWQRFKYNGNVSKQQAVYYINALEIIDNKFGTPAPIPYQDWSHPIPNQMTGILTPLRVEVKCFGKYTFKIVDPFAFVGEVAGLASEIITKDEITEQMRTEVIASFQMVLNALGNSENKVPVLELPSSTKTIKSIMSNGEFDGDIKRRGISLLNFSVESVTLDDESEKKIDQYELASNSMMQQGTLVGAYADAAKEAAGNANGAANGFMGLGMMNMASGGMVGGAATNAFTQTTNEAMQSMQNQVKEQAAPVAPITSAKEETEVKEELPVCPKCGATVTSKFCQECGTAMETKEEPVEKKCPKCGTVITGKFCPECGTAAE